jgi:UDP-2-acetamido-3-amino-2,3-dideoxy-glucuronate N-acetyltransferase
MNDVRIHSTALVETEEIGAGTAVWAFAHVMRGAQVGQRCNIGDHVFIESGAVIGNNVTVKNGNLIWEGVTLEDGVFVGPGVIFTNDLYPRSPRLALAHDRYNRKENWLVPTLVRQGASLGAGAVVVAGVIVGEYALVAAGAVVTKDVPPFALMRGNPARVAGWVCPCGQPRSEPLQFESDQATCDVCGVQFRMRDGLIQPISVSPAEILS